MNSMEQQMMAHLQKVNKLIPDTKTRAAMTEAGAEVLKTTLADTTRRLHYDEKRTKGPIHLADSVQIDNNDTGGIENGNSIVGFTGKDGINHGRIALILNDGSKMRPGDQFVDNARKAARPGVFTAELKVYKELTGGGE